MNNSTPEEQYDDWFDDCKDSQGDFDLDVDADELDEDANTLDIPDYTSEWNPL